MDESTQCHWAQNLSALSSGDEFDPMQSFDLTYDDPMEVPFGTEEEVESLLKEWPFDLPDNCQPTYDTNPAMHSASFSNTESHDSNSNSNLNLYDLGSDFGSESTVLTPDFSSMYHTSPSSQDTNASPYTVFSPDMNSGHESSQRGFPCTADGCEKSFATKHQYQQHQRIHNKTVFCRICRSEGRERPAFSQTRDLERHMHKYHKDEAVKENMRSEERVCPFPGCDHTARKDNVSRHYRKKHGGNLHWRKGKPVITD